MHNTQKSKIRLISKNILKAITKLPVTDYLSRVLPRVIVFI